MRSIIVILSVLLLCGHLDAQMLSPVKWAFQSEHVGGDEYVLQYKATIDDTWTVYSQFTSDEGPVPTSINYESDGFEKIGGAKEDGYKKEGFDKLFETEVIKFLSNKPFTIKQKVIAKAGTKVTGYLTYMTCDATRCLPPTDVDFAFILTPTIKAEPKASHANNVKPVKEVPKASTIKEKVQDIAAEVQSTPKIDLPIIKTKDLNQKESIPEAILNPVTWTISINPLDNGEHELVYTAEMEKPWTVYSQFTSDEGPVPTTITYETPGVQKLDDGTEEGYKKEGYDKLFEVDVIKYLSDEPFVIKHRIKSKAKKIKGYLTYMTCDLTRCLPPTDIEFGFDLNKSSTIPYASVSSSGGNQSSGAAMMNAIGPNITGNTLDNLIPSISASYKSPLGNCKGGEESASSIWSSFIFGFLGGLLALLTPCVFPMIPLTVSFFTKDTKRKGWVNGLIYGLSIIVIYVTLGLAITAIFGPEALNRLSTNWIANTLFFLIFIFFAFSFFGYYEITLPSSWSTKTDTMADKGGFVGIFFMAFTLALVSFSCTGPIIGTALVQSATNPLGPAVVMLGFALALAIPFGLFAAVPALLNSLPRSGSWMNSVKVVLGFLELALAFKFLSVADMTNHWGFLRYELFLGIWILCFAGMTAYLFGLIKFPHDSPIKKLSIPRIVFGLASLAWTVYLATGFMINDKTQSYDSLALMSGLAPPSNYNFFLDDIEPEKSIKDVYPSYSICANGIPCFKDYYEGKAYAKAQAKPIFLDFTGHGCVNCRKTEEHIWVKDEIRDRLIEDFVLVSLYVDDDKKLDNVYIAKESKKKIRNVGNMWADFQITNFKQNSQPLYVMMTADEKVLANPRGYKPDAEAYEEYMKCGLETFDEVQ